jgi:hypothetical protein
MASFATAAFGAAGALRGSGFLAVTSRALPSAALIFLQNRL